MTDSRPRSLQRQAAAGDRRAEVALLRERLRAGERSLLRCASCDGKGRTPSILLVDGGKAIVPPGVYKALVDHAQTAVNAGLRELIAMGSIDVRVSPHMEEPRDCYECAGTGYATLRVGVELAAYCGHEVAREVLGPCDLCAPLADKGPTGWYSRNCLLCGGSNRGFMDWLSGLSRWGEEVLVRGAVAGARVALQAWVNSTAGRGGRGRTYWLRRIAGYQQWMFTTQDGVDVISLESAADGYWRYRPLRAIEAAERWIVEPTGERREACLRIAREQQLPGWIWHVLVGIGEPPFAVQQKRHERAIMSISGVSDAGEQVVRQAICAELIPWALGERDPVRERVGP